MNNPSSISFNAALQQEWITLQNNYEHYERTALLIKLVAIALYAAAWLFDATAMAIAIVAMLWVQEGIFKTYQARLGVRLLHVEALIKQSDSSAAPFQLHSEWLASRQGSAGLLKEYLASIAKPTVAFPYAALLLLELVERVVGFG